MITIKNLSISFDDKTILEEVNLELPRSGLFCIVGHSGSGKSSLLNAISGLIQYKGVIDIDGVRIEGLSEDSLSDFRLKNIGFIFQDFKLFESQTVEQNVFFPLKVDGSYKKKEILRRCNNLLDMVSLKRFNKRICSTLSGGEKQRVALARALINSPKIIMADEPTGSLDGKNGEDVLSILKSVSSRSLVLVVTHDMELANKYADSILKINNKKIEYTSNNIIAPSVELILPGKEIKETKNELTYDFVISHAKQNLRTKKIRSILSTFFMSLGLLGVGLSSSFTNSISKDIKRAYGSLAQTASITVSEKLEGKRTELTNANYVDALEIVNSVKAKWEN